MKYFILLSLFTASLAWGEDRIGEIYAKGKITGEPLFIQSIHIDDAGDGKRIATSFIKNRDGEVVLREDAVIIGTRIVSQTLDQLQIGERWELEVKDDKVYFRTYKVTDGVKHLTSPETSEKIADNFITGPAAEAFLGKALPELNDGKTVDALFGVFEVGRSIEFKFRKLASDDEKISIRMKPASFFVSLMVSPIEMQFSQKEKMLVHYSGRTPVRIKENGKWKVLEADILYKIAPPMTPPPKK